MKLKKFDLICIISSIILMGVITLFYLFENVNFMMVFMFLLFFNNIIYCLINFEKRIISLLFYIAFFTFLLGTIFINFLSGENLGLGYSTNIDLHILLCLSLSLFSLMLGNVLFGKFLDNREKKNKVPAKISYSIDKRFMKLIKVIMYICAVPYFFEIIEKVVFVQTNSYIDLYTGFNSILPSFIAKIASMYNLFFIMYVVCKPNKEEFKFPSFIYIFSGILALGYGQRNLLVLNILFVVVYCFLRNREMPNHKKWITKRMVITGCISLPFLIVFLFVFQSMRYDVSSETNFIESFIGFFKSQGGSVNIIGEGMRFNELLPNHNYTFGPLINTINNNNIIHNFFDTTILQPHTYEMATQGNIFAHSLTYLCNPDLYLRGGGMGSSYIAELYHDFSYIGIIVYNIMLGSFIVYLYRNKNSSIFLSVFNLLMLRSIFYLPRDSAMGFIANSFTITNILIILVICLFYKIYIKHFGNLIQSEGNKTLVLLTNKFPYSTSETFLEPELKYYQSFDNVYIIPFILDKNSLDKRYTSYKVVDLKSKFMNYLKFKSFLLCFLNGDILIEIFNLFWKRNFTMGRFKQIISLAYHGELYYQLILKKIGSKLNNQTVFYSYWLNVQSIAAVKLNKLYSNSVALSRTHGIDLYAYRNMNNYQALREYIKKGLDKIYFISNNGKLYFEETYGRSENYEVAYLGVQNNYIYEKYNRNATFHVVSCSVMIPIKRIHLLIEALSLIDEKNIIWTHIGDGELCTELRRMVDEKLPNSNVNFLGQLSSKEVFEFYKKTVVDLFVTTSQFEGLPVSIMEAMSFGIPVIATQVGAIDEIVFHNKNGYLIDKDFDVVTLTEYILLIINLNNEEFNILRKNAYDTWNEKFNSQKNYKNFAENLEKVIDYGKCNIKDD